jgi:hypothetical protein
MFIKLDQESGRKLLFGRWQCRWNNRGPTAKYVPAGADGD